MVFTCCVPGCRTGYKTKNQPDTGEREKISLFRFPNDFEMKRKWVQAIPRKNFSVGDSHRVCSLHFYPEDLRLITADSNSTRKSSRASVELKSQRLKSDAVPRIFPSLPQYLTRPPSSETKRSETATCTSRLLMENERLMEANLAFLEEDQVKDLNDLKNKIADVNLPSDFSVIIRTNFILFVLIPIESAEEEPKILISVNIDDEMNVSAFVSSTRVTKYEFKHILQDNKVKSTTQLSNVLAHCKSLLQQNTNSVNWMLDSVIMTMQRYISDCPAETCEQTELCQFIIEQLRLSMKDSHARRYSPNLIALSFVWQITSPSLYRKLNDFFILPSASRMKQLSQGSNVDCCDVDLHYLSERTEDKTKQEKTVVLMIDEVYTAQKIAYSNGKFIGFTAEGEPAKTVLTFMVQSLSSKYKDVVCVIPVMSLTVDLLYKWFMNVLNALKDLFSVVAISVDNHIVNRNLYKRLCGGEILPFISHPFMENEKLFLFFDFTHNLKNLFNNWLRNPKMNPPTEDFEDILGDRCFADFTHIKHLYALESEKSIKVGFSLNAASLAPSSIARTSPRHALSVFHESTVRGLRFFADKHPQWEETAKYVAFIQCIWKIVSVKSPSKGMRKRDIFMEPIKSIQDPSMAFLRRATELMENWKASRRSGLTNETFLACLQSMRAMPLCADYLLSRHGFEYVLSGKLLSDPIEGRFGWYRQMNGGNFFLSISHLLVSEKKIRILSKLQQQIVSAASRLHTDSILPLPSSSTSVAENHSWLVDELRGTCIDELSSSDANVSFFVAGYIGRSISKQHHCADCKTLMIPGDVLDDDETFSKIHEDVRCIFEMANRGGLSAPSEFCFAATAFSVNNFNAINEKDDVKKRFMSSRHQSELFVNALLDLARDANCDLFQRCISGHSCLEKIFRRAFNCFAKIELKRLNAPKAVDNSSSRKLRKLTSQCH